MNNPITKFRSWHGTNGYQEKHSDSKLKIVVCFTKRTIKSIALVISTFIFPIPSVLLGLRSFILSSDKNLALSTRIRAAIATVMFPIPLIGPLLFCVLSNNNRVQGITLFPSNVTSSPIKNYFALGIPFTSSFFGSYSLIYDNGNY